MEKLFDLDATTYDAGEDFFVDIVTCDTWDRFEVWGYASGFGQKAFIFAIGKEPKDDTRTEEVTKEEVLALVEEHIDEFKEAYLNDYGEEVDCEDCEYYDECECRGAFACDECPEEDEG